MKTTIKRALAFASITALMLTSAFTFCGCDKDKDTKEANVSTSHPEDSHDIFWENDWDFPVHANTNLAIDVANTFLMKYDYEWEGNGTWGQCMYNKCTNVSIDCTDTSEGNKLKGKLIVHFTVAETGNRYKSTISWTAEDYGDKYSIYYHTGGQWNCYAF